LNFSSAVEKKIEAEKEQQAGMNSCSVLENEMIHQTQKVQNAKIITNLLQAALDQRKTRAVNHKSVVQSLLRRQDEERIFKEELEVQNYHASIEKHTLQEGVELIMLFIEDFAKKLKQEPKPVEQDYASALFAKFAWGFGQSETPAAKKVPVNLYAAA
jgi:hypothetical protein